MKKLLFLALVITSCAPVYVPNLRNAPMLKSRGEFQGSVQIGNGLDVQAAVAVSNNLALIANYNYGLKDEANEAEYHKRRFFEGGLGYFKNTDDAVFEFFAGYGTGEASSYDTYFFGSGSIQATGKFERYFIQPSIGFNKKVFHGTFVPRFSLVDFTQFSSSGVIYSYDEDPVVFFEPAFVGKVNADNNRLFFIFQSGLSVPVTEEIGFDHRTFQISMGIGVRLGGRAVAAKSDSDN